VSITAIMVNRQQLMIWAIIKELFIPQYSGNPTY